MIDFKFFLNEKASELNASVSSSLRKRIKLNGGKIYQIGGAVRDELIGKVSKDLDLLVTGIELNDLQKILSSFGKVDAVGKSFGILKFKPFNSAKEEEPLDISVPRVDLASTGEGHKDFQIKLGKNISLEQDQLRRDFWMNAIAKDIETGELHDIEGKGQYDIQNKQIRVINVQAFSDDPLRMLRAIQFAARFEFKIESETMKQIQQNVKKITSVSASRFEEEFKKLFVKSEKPSLGIDLLYQTKIMSVLLPQSKNDKKINSIIDKLDKKAFPVFLALLLRSYDLKAGQVAFTKFKVSSGTKKSIESVIRYSKDISIDNFDLIEFVMGISSNDLEQIDFYCQALGENTVTNKLRSLKKSGAPLDLRELSVKGNDIIKLGFKGPQIGTALLKLLKYAVENRTNDKKTLINILGK